MGKAVIEEALGEGLYRVRVDYGSTYRDLKIEAIDKALAELEPVLAEHQARLTSAEVIRANAASQIDHMIGVYRQAVAEGVPADEMDPIRQALEDLATAHAEATKQVQIARLSVTDITTLIAETLQQKHALEGLRLVEVFTAWCTDYTEDAQPETEVGTMEVPGEPQQIIIVPGCQPWSPSHGELRKKELMEAHQAYFNVAILPGWQRFWPTYRIGTVTAVHANDTVDVELEGTSTAQNLDIGPPSPTGTASDVVLSSVPVDYMSSGNTVFEVDDRVVVLLQNFDWSQPVVVGFEKEPRPVVGLLCHPADAPQYRVFPRAIHGAVTWRASQLQSPATLNVNYGARGWTDGKKAVSWSNNKNTFFHRAFYRGRQADLVSMFPELYYYNAPDDYVMPWILGCVAAGEYVVALVYTYQPQRAGNLAEQLAVALPLRRVDVVSFKFNREMGPFWLEPTVQHSMVLPEMPYVSNNRGNDPNPAQYLRGRCQGFSQSPLGRCMLFFYDAEVYRFNVSVGDALVVDLEIVPHPHVGENGGIGTYTRIVDTPGHTWTVVGVEYWNSLWRIQTTTQEAKLSGSWYVGAAWHVAGSTETWEPLIYHVDVVRNDYLHQEWEVADLDRWIWDGETYVNIPAQNTRVGRRDDEDHPHSVEARYSGAVNINLMSYQHSLVVSDEYIYDITLGVPGSGPTLNSTTHNQSVDGHWGGTGVYVHGDLDVQEGCYIYNDYTVDSDASPVLDVGDMAVVAGGEIVWHSDASGSLGFIFPLMFSAPPTFPGDQGVPLDVDWSVDPIDPFFYNTAFRFDSPQTTGHIGRVKSGVFFSVVLPNGDVVNYMTDNPTLTGVFPEDSGVDTGANFAPIVPH